MNNMIKQDLATLTGRLKSTIHAFTTLRSTIMKMPVSAHDNERTISELQTTLTSTIEKALCDLENTISTIVSYKSADDYRDLAPFKDADDCLREIVFLESCLPVFQRKAIGIRLLWLYLINPHNKFVKRLYSSAPVQDYFLAFSFMYQMAMFYRTDG